MNRREFLKSAAGALGLAAGGGILDSLVSLGAESASSARRPNILFAIADDWSWPHAGAYGEAAVRTPTFDRVASDGVLFTHAYTAAPQCSPNRAAILTGRNIWQLEEAGTHSSIFPNKFLVFTDMLEASGYHVGFTGKGWAPGDWKAGGRRRNPAGREFNSQLLIPTPTLGITNIDYAANFEKFLKARPDNAPFCFWFGCHEPHREYEAVSGRRKGGKKQSQAPVPAFLPDATETRDDILDYFYEVEWYDRQLSKMLRGLREAGELDNTIVVVTSDNGMPFPRAKANLYEYGVRVPLAIRWPGNINAGRETDAPFSFIDFAPTFLAAAGIQPPPDMTGVNYLDFLTSTAAEPPRDHVLTGRERHGHARFDNLGYPSRAIRTREHLFVRNFRPDRWPAGDPKEYFDVDDSPTKKIMLANPDRYPDLFELAFGKRPAEEFFDAESDPCCMNNLAGKADYDKLKNELSEKLDAELKAQGDPRALYDSDIFDSYPRNSHMHPALGGFSKQGEYNPRYK